MSVSAERSYLSCAETAKLLRTHLRREFPGVKFSVRSSTYAGGASSAECGGRLVARGMAAGR